MIEQKKRGKNLKPETQRCCKISRQIIPYSHLLQYQYINIFCGGLATPFELVDMIYAPDGKPSR